eukprot:CAMPEP_0175984232 /NCGR_PEP_ID=MMETSP0108-20121206/48901_1 /TAXON_ID=195067 ORGANISM="Goniomonas pacifica, Strain CCMP1869" /NCGR_SAMPLE_ID=MMETSP0108 /ASSEMBLY_ACC=CAM_ASM_000204 /LENGTH=193 /DNA_ID=CAMNT_0017315099 /DNA_START=281 /DNA_END=862 /DNA_ORIENTATION=+
MDFSKHHPASYVHLPNGTVLQHGPALPWGWFRHHHDVLRVHLGISDLETQIQQNQGTLDDCKPENNCFFMEDAFAWEYSGQFCINSAALWQRIATLVELSRDGFFSQRLMPQANSRKFRSTHDIVSNHDEVALFLKEQRMDYFLMPSRRPCHPQMKRYRSTIHPDTDQPTRKEGSKRDEPWADPQSLVHCPGL